MKMHLPPLACAAAVLAASFPAQAGGHYHHHRSYGHHGHHYAYTGHKHFRHHHGYYRHRHHHDDIGDEILLGAGIIGGAVIVGSILSQPRTAPPPPVYYYTPPPQPTCVQDQVYRYLPDGRIQWGTRTRCY